MVHSRMCFSVNSSCMYLRKICHQFDSSPSSSGFGFTSLFTCNRLEVVSHLSLLRWLSPYYLLLFSTTRVNRGGYHATDFRRPLSLRCSTANDTVNFLTHAAGFSIARFAQPLYYLRTCNLGGQAFGKCKNVGLPVCRKIWNSIEYHESAAAASRQSHCL